MLSNRFPQFDSKGKVICGKGVN